MLRIKPSTILVVAFLVLVALLLVESGRAATMTKGPKPIFSNSFELIGNFVRPPLCVGPGEHVQYIYEVKNIGLNPVQAEVRLDFWVGGEYGIKIANAKPSLRGSVPSHLYWPVSLAAGKTAKLRLTVVVPDWTGGFEFGFGYSLIIPGMSGWQFTSTTGESCFGGYDEGK